MTGGDEPVRWAHDFNGVTVSGALHTAGGRRGAVVIAPALGVSARSYDRLGSAIAAADLTVLVLDYGWGPGAEGYDYSALARYQLPAAVHYARALEVGPVWIVGHSLGAQAAVLGGMSGDMDADGLLIVAGGVPDNRCYPGFTRWKPLAGTAIACLVAHACGHLPAGTLGIAVNVPTTLVDEWARWCWTGRLPLDRSGLTVKPFTKVAALVLDSDDLAPVSCTRALLAILEEDASHVVKTAAGRGHVEWLRSPAAVAQEIVAVISDEHPLNTAHITS